MDFNYNLFYFITTSKTKKGDTAATKQHHTMVKKKRSMSCKRKKSNTRINVIEEESKHTKTKEAVSDAKNRLVSAIKAMIDSMNEEHL